jgi:hypothetical protein
MRTVTFKSVYEEVVRLAGLDPDDSGFSAARQEFVADCINRRVRECWEYDFWPELCVTEARTMDANDVVAYEPTSEIALGEVEGVYDRDPFQYPDTAKRWEFVATENGIQVQDTSAATPVYVKYRRRPNRFTRVAWVEGTDYADGALIYYATTGECYQVQSVSGVLTWVWVAMPYVFSAAVVQLALADYLRNTGQTERADEAQALGYKALEDAHIRSIQQQGGVSRARVVVA